MISFEAWKISNQWIFNWKSIFRLWKILVILASICIWRPQKEWNEPRITLEVHRYFLWKSSTSIRNEMEKGCFHMTNHIKSKIEFGSQNHLKVSVDGLADIQTIERKSRTTYSHRVEDYCLKGRLLPAKGDLFLSPSNRQMFVSMMRISGLYHSLLVCINIGM